MGRGRDEAVGKMVSSHMWEIVSASRPQNWLRRPSFALGKIN
jgi:hypothetical protein